MKWTLTIGAVAGIPIKLHFNWFLTAALVAWALSAAYFPQTHPGWQTQTYWLVGTASAALFFLSVLLHELGHSITAQREGVEVNSITLFVFGGVAHIADEPPTAGAEFRIVAAGPLTSLFLAALFSTVGWAGILGPLLSGAAVYLGQMNVVLALFNLLPGFPLDGGRILRSALWKWMGDFRRATHWASRAGVGLSLAFIALGVGLIVWGDLFSGGWVAFVGWFLGTAARDGYREAETQAEANMNVLAEMDERRIRAGGQSFLSFTNSARTDFDLPSAEPAHSYVFVPDRKSCPICQDSRSYE
jgi:Zn-dependent protease